MLPIWKKTAYRFNAKSLSEYAGTHEESARIEISRFGPEPKQEGESGPGNMLKCYNSPVWKKIS